jgi:L-alanine-DL-glutamate epimerase-like enolase superfamily enzyme
MQSDIRVLEVETRFEPVEARTPLKFGAVVVPACTFFRCRTTVENRRGQRADGWGGIFIMDFWAYPTTAVPHPDKEECMRRVSQRYADLIASYQDFAHPIDIFCEHEEALAAINRETCAEMALVEPMPFLGALVSASPVDAALHDAFGNANGIDTYNGYTTEFMAHDLSHTLGPEFAGKYPGDYLRDAYLPEIPIFHLVGGLDKLTQEELTDSDPQDGLPNSLDEWVARDGVFCLKVKLRGNDLEWDVDRTVRVYEIGKEQLTRRGEDRLHMSADTNEQCESPDYIVEYLHKLHERCPAAFGAVLYVEQPTERDLTAHRWDMRPIAALKPVIIDESLVDFESFELAIELGWSGIALKTCKCQSADMLFVPKAAQRGMPYTVQDLTNPSLALIHSVGLGARTHTMMGVEANSRQFFPFATPEAERRVHPDIFTVQNGVAKTSSLRGTGLGYQMDRILGDG